MSTTTPNNYDDAKELVLSGFQTMPMPQWNDENLEDMLEKCACFGAVAIDDNRVLVVGGSLTGDVNSSATTVYDVRNNQWSSSGWPNLNTPRNGFATAMCNNKVYVIGGQVSDDSFLSSIECLDLSLPKLQWVTLKQKLARPRDSCVAVVVGHVIYIVGGRYYEADFSDALEIFDTNSGAIQYHQSTSLLVARAGGAAALVGNKVWFVGGSTIADENGHSNKVTASIEYLNINLETGMPVGGWMMAPASMKHERFYPSVTALYHCLLIVGGSDDRDQDLSSTEMFDTERKVSFRLPSMSVPRFGCTAIALGKTRVIAMGGYNESSSNLSSIESISLPVFGGSPLFQLCQSKCAENVSISNVKEMLTAARLHNADRLLHFCLEFVRENAESLFADFDFFSLSKEDPHLWRSYVLKKVFSSDSISRKRAKVG